MVSEVIDIGRGAACRVDCPGLVALSRALAERWRAWLSVQDRGGVRPHVTVQNNVDSATARSTLAKLRAGFSPFRGMATGPGLWHYRGGPSEPAGEFGFTGGKR